MGSIQIPSYEEKANCIQYLFCRPFFSFLYGIVIALASFIYGIVLAVFSFVNCFSVVCGQKYSKSFYDWFVRIYEWEAKFAMYSAGLTSEKPEMCP